MNIVIVEDSPAQAANIKYRLAGLPMARIVGVAAGNNASIEMIDSRRPDVVLLGAADSLAVLGRVRARQCGSRMLVLAENDDDGFRNACLDAGADGVYHADRDMADVVKRLVGWLPPVPDNEGQRLRALQRLALLDTDDEEVFDEITCLCAELLEVPIALVSLIDADRQWFKSRVGLDIRETSRSVSFCAHTVHQGSTLVVEDAARDPRFADSPLVRGPHHIRFYAGVPLVLPGGEAVGTLCVIDRQPRRISPVHTAVLEILARKLVTELELRQRVGRLEQEIERRREMEVRIMHLATRDPLTGLPNRAALMDRLRQAIRVADREGQRIAFLFLDLDRFKLINDTLGHSVGDGLLQQVGERLSALLRESDTVARLGGDEFAVILPKIDSIGTACAVAAKMLAALHQPMDVRGHALRPDCSIGLAVYPEQGESDELLIRHADLALYEAKRSGTHQWRVFEPSMNDAAVRRLTLESELRQALEKDEFILHYQPQVSLRTGCLTGVEALVRWRHPTLGLVPPSEFIPLAEETGLIWDIGRRVLGMACDQMTEWLARGIKVPRLSVNVSPAQLRPELVGMVRDGLSKFGCESPRLELEITESALTADGPQVLELLEALSGLGVSIAVDDFGVGYSSLALLRRLPLDCLKVDKSFVDEMVDNFQDATIVEAVMRIGEGLGLRTVAEGVETEEQRQALAALGCECAQGYLFARPMPPASFETWLGATDTACAPALANCVGK